MTTPSKSISTIAINTPYIQLGQILKMLGLVNTGGETKAFLLMHVVFVNQVQEQRRGRKLYPGDVILVEKHHVQISTR